MGGRRQRASGFPRHARLTEPGAYARVFSGATRVADRYFTILLRDNTLQRARLGLAVSRRVTPRAVARNRIKRLIREHFRQRRSCLPATDCVVIAKPCLRYASKERVHHSLERLWEKVQGPCERR